MANNLQRSIVRSTIISSAVVAAISLFIAAIFGDAESLTGKNLFWLLVLTLIAAGTTFFSVLYRIKKNVLQPLSNPISYEKLDAAIATGDISVDRALFDDYTSQLATRGFHRIGFFRPKPATPGLSGICAIHLNERANTIVEVQHIVAVTPGAAHLNGTHFSICSYLQGVARIVTTDHIAQAPHFLCRGNLDYVSSRPGTSLMHLLAEHNAVVHNASSKLGREVLNQLTVERYLLSMRRSQGEAHARLSALSGWQIAREVDQFEANPLSRWSPNKTTLATLPMSELSSLDSSQHSNAPPLILNNTAASLPLTTSSDNSSQVNPSISAQAEQEALASAQQNLIQAQKKAGIESSANWFYWIGGMTVVNLIAQIAGSTWGFAIGLGVSTVFNAIAQLLVENAEGLSLIQIVLWMLAFGSAAAIAYIGRLAARPSFTWFVVGGVLYTIDTLIFLYASDWLGLALHVFALFFIVRGAMLARTYKGQRT